MTSDAPAVRVPQDIDLDDDAQVDRAMRRAVRAALCDHQQAGDYVVAWQDERVVQVPAHEIMLPEEDL